MEVRIPADAVTSANRQARTRGTGQAAAHCCELCSRAARVEEPVASNLLTPAGLPSTQVRARQLWGTDVYSEDSDVVAVLVHTGHYALPPGATPPQGLTELRATLKPQPCPGGSFLSTSRHGIRSRAWGAGGGSLHSFGVAKCSAVMASGAVVDLDPGAWRRAPGPLGCVPTFQLGAQERGGHATRGGGEGGGRGGGRNRYCQEVTLQYSLSNEPWLKYTLGAVADRGLKRAGWTSARLRGEVLFLETPRHRFQLTWDGLLPGHQGSSPEVLAQLDSFSFARCRAPALDVHEVQSLGVPLPVARLEVLAKSQAWQSIHWGLAGVTVKGVQYPVCRLLFMPHSPATGKLTVPPVVK